MLSLQVLKFNEKNTYSNIYINIIINRGQKRGERGVAVAKFRSRRLAIDITVTMVTGVAPPGSACLLLFSEGGEPAPYLARFVHNWAQVRRMQQQNDA